jgi:hypothetical protein
MFGHLLLAFIAGGMFGMVGMAILGCGSKMRLHHENGILGRRLEFLEKEGATKRYKPVKDPRPRVHTLVH